MFVFPSSLLLLMMHVIANLNGRHHGIFYFDPNYLDGENVKTNDQLSVMGLSPADMEELKEVSDTAVSSEDLESLHEVMALMSEEELEQLSEMTEDELERFFEEQMTSSSYRRKKRDVRYIYEHHDGSIEKEQDQRDITTNPKTIITAAIGDEEVKLEVVVADAGDEYRILDMNKVNYTSYDRSNFKEDDKLRFSLSTKVRREASPDPEPEPEPEAMNPARQTQPQQQSSSSIARNREEKFLAEYTRRFR